MLYNSLLQNTQVVRGITLACNETYCSTQVNEYRAPCLLDLGLQSVSHVVAVVALSGTEQSWGKEGSLGVRSVVGQRLTVKRMEWWWRWGYGSTAALSKSTIPGAGRSPLASNCQDNTEKMDNHNMFIYNVEINLSQVMLYYWQFYLPFVNNRSLLLNI